MARTGGGEHVEIDLTLSLPRDELTVPVARRIVDTAIRSIGVAPDCAADITLALTEACTNVVKHADPHDDYEVNFHLDDGACTIRVLNFGEFDLTRLVDAASGDAEGGRGFQLMRALVDDLHFASDPDNGTVVMLQKQLQYAPGTLLDLTVQGRADEPVPTVPAS
jgi:serine/threonine-protein kinase RsbW